ncbi:BMP family ABC transporter substrate-binding protein [Mobilitalea sibirica]|uniref:BMP family ABC transporter substrate-binding protein n=2 Tax=Mobilitalea sibirica TaxID=1462919 RepID=A0A8J7KZX6_9FIRM|nr:BMP family ABC transporter substrate-binding protein [Mobilitalea sibirica]MBH1941163.1 BMP family ABC transporter substrate-binding protein [Mobilitalea sibirica]
MKKFWVLIFVAVMALTLSACSKEGKETSNTTDFKVAVIHIGDPADGAGYTYAHDLGIVKMQEELGLSDEQIIRKNNVNDTDAVAITTAMEECIEEGADIIFGTSWGYMDTMEQLAAEHSEVIFSHCSGYKNNGSNMNNYFGRIYQARYLSGIAAGLKTQSNMIGYVAAMPIDNSEVTGGINAFALGVESVNPDAKVYVKVTNTWFDPTLEGQAAEALLDMGCDVITQHGDTTAPQMAAQARGVWGVGYNSDMTKDAPEAHLTAPIWNWGAYYTKATKEAMEGNWSNDNYFGGMDDGLIDLSPLSKNVAEGTEEAIEAARQRILDGYKIFEGELYDNQGNLVCAEGEALADADITGAMNWYYKTVEVK